MKRWHENQGSFNDDIDETEQPHVSWSKVGSLSAEEQIGMFLGPLPLCAACLVWSKNNIWEAYGAFGHLAIV